MAAVVDADSEAEPDASESEFEPGKEAEAESEVASSPHAVVKAWAGQWQAAPGTAARMPSSEGQIV